jgi:hypothetical protein
MKIEASSTDEVLGDIPVHPRIRYRVSLIPRSAGRFNVRIELVAERLAHPRFIDIDIRALNPLMTILANLRRRLKDLGQWPIDALPNEDVQLPTKE